MRTRENDIGDNIPTQNEPERTRTNQNEPERTRTNQSEPERLYWILEPGSMKINEKQLKNQQNQWKSIKISEKKMPEHEKAIKIKENRCRGMKKHAKS